MECTVSWTGASGTQSGMGFVAETGSGHTLMMDGAPDAALLDAAQKGDFAAASRDFDANMRSKLKPEQFKKAWDSLAQFGALQARGQSHAAEADGYIAITVPLLFEKKNLYAQVACGSDGRVAGFYVKPLETPAQ